MPLLGTDTKGWTVETVAWAVLVILAICALAWFAGWMLGKAPGKKEVAVAAAAATALAARPAESDDRYTGMGEESVTGGCPCAALTHGGDIANDKEQTPEGEKAAAKRTPAQHKTSRADTHTEVYDALAAAAKSGKPGSVWLVGPSAVGKTSLGYALKDEGVEGVAIIPLDNGVRTATRGMKLEDAMGEYASVYGEPGGDPSAESVSKFDAWLKGRVERAKKEAPKLIVFEGALRAPARARLAKSLGADAPAETWVLVPGAGYQKNLLARVKFRAGRLAARKTPATFPVRVPGTNDDISTPPAELAAMSEAQILTKHKALFAKALKTAKNTWAAEAKPVADGKEVGRVFNL